MTDWHDTFLEDLDPRPWGRPDGVAATLEPAGLFLGSGEFALEVALVDSPRKPRNDDVRRLWHARQGGRASPLLLAVGFPDHGSTKVALCGPAGEQPPIVTTTLEQAERLARAALGEPSRHAAIRFLATMLPEVDTELPGVRSSGLLANHELRDGVPQRADWSAACERGKRLLRYGGRKLFEHLGFRVEQLGTTASVLATPSSKRAVAVFLDEGETFDDPATRFSGTSPVSHALALADRENLPWVIATRHRQVRLYAARPDVGVGRKGRADTYVEVNLALIPDDRAGYVPLLFGSEALVEGGTLDEILDSSARFATDLATRLRERVYFECVPSLAEAVAAGLGAGDEPTETELTLAYECTLTILFRLLFVAYAEDKDLLPYRTNSKYADHSLKLIARRLAEDRRREFTDYDAEACEYWEDVKQLWRAVEGGNRSWGVPPYDGGLFSSDPAINPAGAAITRLELPDAQFARGLSALLVDVSDTEGDIGPVDFRSLSVREFGTIYEGLLESTLAVAPDDLTVDEDGNYVPVRSARDEVWVEGGAIYFHNRSGARKATGSYFTKPFAVAHLLDQALEPVLADHVDRLQRLVEAGDEAAAASSFFDFRCVDLAMGSGHFLTAAVDRIEARLSAFLALHPVGAVHTELETLRRSAMEALGALAGGVEIETTSLIRRLVARRCVYGVDLNPIAVELARLSLWIHTFVPGLPLSFLSHSLVAGNSLTGIGTIGEVLRELDPDHDPERPSLFRGHIESLLERAATALNRLATVADATVPDVRAAAAAHAEALEAVHPARLLFDVVVAARLRREGRVETLDEADVAREWERRRAGELAEELHALHLPVAFPEVFMRRAPGFDCVIGNPPWDKLKHEPQQFWVSRVPGLNALPASQRDAAIARLREERPDDARAEEEEAHLRELLQDVAAVGYRLTGGGHHDFAKLFTERAMDLVSESGCIGYVLPRPSLVLGGWGKLRQALFEGRVSKTAQARNSRGWLFDDIHLSTTVVLLSRLCTDPTPGVRIWPDVSSVDEVRQASDENGFVLSEHDLSNLSDSYVIPWFNSTDDVSTFDKMRHHPTLSSGNGWITGHHDARWDFRGSGPHRSLAHGTRRTGDWAVLMTRHVNAYRLDTSHAFQKYVAPAELAQRHVGIDASDQRVSFADTHPWILVRHPARNDDSRTMIATALPSSGFIYNKGYVHAVALSGDWVAEEGLALLGFLNTLCCDWWARRFVDRHVTAPVVNRLVLPSWDDSQIKLACELASSLLVSNGLADLAVIGPVGPLAGRRDPTEARLELERLAIDGFGLTRSEVAGVLADFKETEVACPPSIRSALLAESARV